VKKRKESGKKNKPEWKLKRRSGKKRKGIKLI
jgi:hypothetical protein